MELVLIVTAACGLMGCFGCVVGAGIGPRRHLRLASRASLR